MKKVFTIAFCAMLSVLGATAQTHNMQIKLKSGETVTYKTTDVTNVTFEEESTPIPPQPGVFDVEFDLQELTSTSCKLKVTPSDDTRYYAGIWTRDWMQNPNGGLLPDAKIIESCIGDPYYDDKCFTGETVLTFENGVPELELVAVVFDAFAKEGVDAEVFTYSIKLNQGAAAEAQFEISNQVIGFEDVKFHAKAKDSSKFMIARVLEKSYFEKYGEAVMQRLYFMLNNDSGALSSMAEYVKENGAYGERDFYFANLKPNTEYVAAVFYVDPENEDVNEIYDWNYTRWDFTTKAPTTKPTLELTNAKKIKNTDGSISISVHAKATNAVYAIYKAGTIEWMTAYDLDGASDLYVLGLKVSASDLEKLNSPEGLDIFIPSCFEKDGDYGFVMRVKDAEGGRTTVGVELTY